MEGDRTSNTAKIENLARLSQWRRLDVAKNLLVEHGLTNSGIHSVLAATLNLKHETGQIKICNLNHRAKINSSQVTKFQAKSCAYNLKSVVELLDISVA